MSATPPPGDRRPIPAVAIVGNDAVLAAAPATPVQLAHACLRRGFAVAVPASWGDELVAAEVVRRLAAREKGPAVMCACPYVRAHLLTPGPDLAPFLVSLVAPPVAAARYLRTVYGEHGVHITYIGGCPAADDPAIDVRLTPDLFFADLAEQSIALSEQPLVFDSIVPPDRRRWCSLPGGAPSADVLWNETDARTLVEIDRDDVSTDLAQQIMTREHVLLDLAPSLGCVCSGAVPSLPPRSARIAVTALEPPRALGPVIDPAAVVPLDVPVGAAAAGAHPLLNTPAARARPGHPAAPAVLHDVLDQEIGRSAIADVAITTRSIEPANAPTDDPAAVEVAIDDASGQIGADSGTPFSELRPGGAGVAATEACDEAAWSYVEQRDEPADEAPPWTSASAAPMSGTHTPSDSSHDDEGESVRRRTPPSLPVRHPAASIPRASAGDGRSLPRAYVARRRTPTGVTPVAETGNRAPPPPPGSVPGSAASSARESAPRPAPGAASAPTQSPGDDAGPAALAAAAPAVKPSSEPPAAPLHVAPRPPARPPEAAVPSASTAAATRRAPGANIAPHNGPPATPAANRGVLSVVLIGALVALFAYVVAALRR